jgi:hypothetical protein
MDSQNTAKNARVEGIELQGIEGIFALGVCRITFDGPASSQFTFSADSLGALGIDILIGLCEFFGESAFAGLALMPFTEFEANLSRFAAV